MKRKDEPLDNGHRLGDFKDFDAQLLAAFSKTSAIEVAIYDSQLRFLAVNKAASAVPGIPPEAFVGRTIRDIIGDAAAEPEARLRRALVADEIPAAEITSVLPTRGELGYWILKSVPIRCQSGRVGQMVSLAVEVTAQRKLEKHFRKLGGELLWRKEQYQWLARDLHDSINEYHAALGMSLDRLGGCTRNPEKIPELLAQSDFLDGHMRKLASAVARCFPIDRQH